jgi:multiple sugar transport system ATP-binding protein
VPLPREVVSHAGGSVTIGVRPKDLEVSVERGHGLPVTVDLVEELGADGYLYGHADVNGRRTAIVVRVDGRLHPSMGDRLWLTPKAGHVDAFSTENGLRLTDAVLV